MISPIGVQSFWAWDGAAERRAEWKSAYNLAGRFINATPYTALQTAQIRLVEDDANWHDSVEATNEAFGQFDVPGIVNAGVEIPHSFRVAGKEFKWLEKIGWSKIAGALYRYYHYRVFIKLSDIYGNDYPAFADVNSLAATLTICACRWRSAQPRNSMLTWPPSSSAPRSQ